MSKLILTTAYAKDSTNYSSASPILLTSESIVRVENASLAMKRSVPAASGSINSVILTNPELNNAGERQTYLVGETLAQLVTASS